jgi:TetR/AcrR family transcriptional repressor of uid operon
MPGEDRRRQILDAAALCFARRGFHQATMKDICEEAAMSPGSVYRYFAGKDDLIAALVERDLVQTVGRIEALGKQNNLPAALRGLADVVLAELADPVLGPLQREIGSEALRNPRVGELLRKSDATVIAALAAALRRAQRRGEIDPGLEPAATAEILVAIVDGLSWRVSLVPGTHTARYAPTVHALLTRFLSPK